MVNVARMWSAGTGAGVMKRIALSMVGGIVTAALLSLLIYPAIYVLWKWWAEVRPLSAGGPPPSAPS